ncbi:MAG: hypothetical protein ACXACU_00670 [Candidatus Hodarchaeales archaeon]|jgi:hypothetical protein
MSKSDCENFVKEADDALKHSLEIAASLFEDAAKCYDRQGDRKKSGQYLTIAGNFFLDISRNEKAATCYGKAILRHLMIDDLETAQILIKKGETYGFTISNHQYRIALDAMERQATANIEEEKKHDLDQEIGEDLPEIDILVVEEEESLIPIETDAFPHEEDVIPTMQDFIVPQLEEEDHSELSSFAILAAVSKAAREKKNVSIDTNAAVKDSKGESRYIEPVFTIKPIESLEIKINSKIPPKSDSVEIDTTAKESLKSDPIENHILKNKDTLDLDYSAKTELENEYEEELQDVEIVNTIPFQWQVIDVISDFELNEKIQTDEGMVFNWRKDQINPGEKFSIEYVLRKRVDRSIILRRENRVIAINLYYSIEPDLCAHLDFVNTSGKVFREVLIEDIIPPELAVNRADTEHDFKPATIPTHDSTLFRWIFRSLPPGDSFTVDYEFREKPLTRHYIDEIEHEEGVIKIEKISQPVVDSMYYEYIWFYIIDNSSSDEMTLTDRIPTNFELILVDPIHLRPSIQRDKTQNLLSWKIEPKENKVIIIRLQGNESFTPLSPSLDFIKLGNTQLVERNTSSEKRMIDLRRLKLKLQEST